MAKSVNKLSRSFVKRSARKAWWRWLGWSSPRASMSSHSIERMHLPDPTPDNHIETRFDADDGGTLMIMRMTLPDAAARAAMLATGMEQGMEASYVRLESM